MDIPQTPAQNELWTDHISLRGSLDGHICAAQAILARETPAPILIPGLRLKDIRLAKDGLIRFDAEVPLEEQAAWALTLPRDPEFDEQDDGVTRKDGTDKKIFLHYRPDLEEQLFAQSGITLLDWQKEWLAACNRIRNVCVKHLIQLARQMDILRPGYEFEKRVMDYVDQCLVRVLKYVPREGIIAKPHTDRSAITFHLAESASGLCSISGFETYPHATPKTPSALCFTGQQLERITEGAVPSVWHKVENNTPDRERWAIVFFGKMRPK